MNAARLYMARHGETEWNLEGRMQGRLDSPLTALGVQQALWLGDALKDVAFAAVYASPSPRARRTAELICGDRALTVSDNAAFYEMDLGLWEGRLHERVKRQEPERHEAFWNRPQLYKPAQGESFADVRARVVPELARLARRHRGRNVLIVTHTVTLKVAMAHYTGRTLEELWHPPYFHPACLCVVDVEDDRHAVVRHGDVSHYREDATGW